MGRLARMRKLKSVDPFNRKPRAGKWFTSIPFSLRFNYLFAILIDFQSLAEEKGEGLSKKKEDKLPNSLRNMLAVKKQLGRR
jgi:hypothetical protein